MWYFLLKATSERFIILRFVLVGCLAACGFYYAAQQWRPLPWSLDAALLALLFVSGGHAAKVYSKQLHPQVSKIYLKIAAILGLASGLLNGFYANASYHHVDMNNGCYGNPLLFIVGAFSGIYLVILAVQKLPPLSAIQFIGRYSVVYLCVHLFPLYQLMHVRPNLTERAYFNSVISASSPIGSKYHEIAFLVLRKFISSTEYVMVACAFITVLVLLLIRIAPWALGKRSFVPTSGQFQNS
jgi:uncharacterized membrane protein